MLNTFGAILAFAIRLEQEAIDRYACAVRLCPPGRAREGLEKLERQAAKRKELLERTRREGIMEMSLEPIAGLNRGDYANEGFASEGGSIQELLRSAIEVERGAERFYSDSAAKLTLPEVAKLFLRLAKERDEQANELRNLLDQPQ